MKRDSTLDELACQEIFALLSQYLDSELPADLCAKLSGHIKGCAPCVQFVDSLRQSIAICKDLKVEHMPSPLAEEVRLKLRHAYEGVQS